MNVLEIIQQHLARVGADGLANGDEECGCDKDGLAPCGQVSLACVPGHRCYIPDGNSSMIGYVCIVASHRYNRAPKEPSPPALVSAPRSPDEH